MSGADRNSSGAGAPPRQSRTSQAVRRPQPEPLSRGRRPRLLRNVRAESIKLRSLRSARWVLFAAFVVLPAIGGALTAAVLASFDGTARADSFFDACFVGAQLSSLLLAALAASNIAGELSTRTAITTFAVSPARTSVLAAKAIVLGCAAAASAGAGVALTYAVTSAQLAGHDLVVSLSAPGVARSLRGLVLYLAGMAVLGLGLGALLRSTAAAICTLVVLLYAVPLTLALVPTSPLGGALERWWVTNTVNNLTHLRTDEALLTPGAGTIAFLAWVVLVFALGAIRLRRQAV